LIRLRDLGARVALDDFGSGASFFDYLKHLPVDLLKIDGQFVKNILDDPMNRAAVCCFRDVARICNIRTIAEFVETEEVLDELKMVGIDYAQGYHIHRPESLESIQQKLPVKT
jgi:diguanylate cyclase